MDDAARAVNINDTHGIADINIIEKMGNLNINLYPYAKPFLPQTPCTKTLIESLISILPSCIFTRPKSEGNKNFVLNHNTEIFCPKVIRAVHDTGISISNGTPSNLEHGPELSNPGTLKDMTQSINGISVLNESPIAHDMTTPVLSVLSVKECNSNVDHNDLDEFPVLDTSLVVHGHTILKLSLNPLASTFTSSLMAKGSPKLSTVKSTLNPLAKQFNFRHYTSVLEDNYIAGTEESNDPSNVLKNIKKQNINRLVIVHLNINSLRSKFEQLASLIKGNIDILVMSETKIDDSFPTQQFIIEGYTRRYGRDRNKEGGGVLIYVRDDLGSKELHGIDRSLDLARSRKVYQ